MTTQQIILLCSCWLLGFSTGSAQFTRITYSGNPLVSDQLESGGGTWIDVNKDGYLDLYVSNGNLLSQNNVLYLNDGNGGFFSVTSGAFVNDGGSSIGSTWGDYDSDGIVDCFVTNRQNFGNFLYKGTGDTGFVKIISGAVVTDIANSNSSSWVDLDKDGNLDLYIVNFQGNDFFYHNNGSPNYTFTKIDTLLSIGDGANFSISGSWADFNNDGLSDLFVGNAGAQNDYLYRNNSNNIFTRIVLADGKASVGNSWGDYDNDGVLDLFVANTLAQNNVLYHNSGYPSFSLDPVLGGIESNDGGNSVGSAWGDYDNDGDLDLFVGNDGGNNFLYQNDGYPDYTFTKITSGSVVNDGGNSFGAVWGDYDNDGSLDLFVANRLNQQNFLYHNDGNSNHWIKLKCIGTQSNKSAIGTRIRIRATINGIARWQLREIQGQTGYNSQNLNVHFGLGDATGIDSIIVQWPSGLIEYYVNLTADQSLTFIEGAPLAPVLISTTVGNNALTLRWNKSVIGNFDHYSIFMDTATNPILEVDSAFSADDTVMTISGLTNYTRYYVRVKAVNDNQISSLFSNELSSIPLPVTPSNIDVVAKWNIISLPVKTVDSAVSILFPSAVSQAYLYDDSVKYQPNNVLRSGIGYWIKFSNNDNIPISGFPTESETVLVSEGWNLIGSISQPVPVQSIISDPPGMITSKFFGYNHGYFFSDTVQPGKGYWVKTDQAGGLMLASSSMLSASSRIKIVTTPEFPPPPPVERGGENPRVPRIFSLQQNYPNPFNPSTTLSYEIAEESRITLEVYNTFGEKVEILVDAIQGAGLHSTSWNSTNISSGVYFYRMTAISTLHPTVSFSGVKKMLILK